MKIRTETLVKLLRASEISEDLAGWFCKGFCVTGCATAKAKCSECPFDNGDALDELLKELDCE